MPPATTNESSNGVSDVELSCNNTYVVLYDFGGVGMYGP